MQKDNPNAATEIQQKEAQILEFVKEFKIKKAEFITLQEDILYEKWAITETNGRSKSDHSIEFAYVSFRSMTGKDKAM